jgi:hypothetical protein
MGGIGGGSGIVVAVCLNKSFVEIRVRWKVNGGR